LKEKDKPYHAKAVGQIINRFCSKLNNNSPSQLSGNLFSVITYNVSSFNLRLKAVKHSLLTKIISPIWA